MDASCTDQQHKRERVGLGIYAATVSGLDLDESYTVRHQLLTNDRFRVLAVKLPLEIFQVTSSYLALLWLSVPVPVLRIRRRS
jgi:hypothetical protein